MISKRDEFMRGIRQMDRSEYIPITMTHDRYVHIDDNGMKSRVYGYNNEDIDGVSMEDVYRGVCSDDMYAYVI